MRKKHKSLGLHDKLMQKDGSYAKWHKHPLQKIAQWVFLLAVIVVIGYLLVNRMNDPYAPYSYRWNVNKKVASGTHTTMTKAYDAAGNSSTATISVVK